MLVKFRQFGGIQLDGNLERREAVHFHLARNLKKFVKAKEVPRDAKKREAGAASRLCRYVWLQLSDVLRCSQASRSSSPRPRNGGLVLRSHFLQAHRWCVLGRTDRGSSRSVPKARSSCASSFQSQHTSNASPHPEQKTMQLSNVETLLHGLH